MAFPAEIELIVWTETTQTNPVLAGMHTEGGKLKGD